jgi:hypothetical protein
MAFVWGQGAQQVPRLPGFPVDLDGVGGLHAVFPYGKPHTRALPSAAWQEIRVCSG